MIYRSRELAKDFDMSFMSMENDREDVVRRLFVESRPYSDILKKLLVIDQPDCLDDSKHQYQTIVDDYSVARLKSEGFIRFSPKMLFREFDNVKSYIYVSFDDVAPSESNPEFNNMTMSVYCLCDPDPKYWELDDYAIRPWKMAGYVNGILNKSRMSGIGQVQFIGASELAFDENVAGVALNYLCVHWTDDQQKVSEVAGHKS